MKASAAAATGANTPSAWSESQEYGAAAGARAARSGKARSARDAPKGLRSKSSSSAIVSAERTKASGRTSHPSSEASNQASCAIAEVVDSTGGPLCTREIQRRCIPGLIASGAAKSSAAAAAGSSRAR